MQHHIQNGNAIGLAATLTFNSLVCLIAHKTKSYDRPNEKYYRVETITFTIVGGIHRHLPFNDTHTIDL